MMAKLKYGGGLTLSAADFFDHVQKALAQEDMSDKEKIAYIREIVGAVHVRDRE
ncbi:MAG TPA: hypothetical protein VJY15_07680 [Candidatus Acidoferrum sp.]|nr:hypothetical protein [Candidatus Acidoferrum sp.]